MNELEGHYTQVLEREVESYRRRRGEGQRDPLAHEQLRERIEDWFGTPAAEYFDAHHALPYVSDRWLPWPMSRSSAQSFELARGCLAAVVLVVTWRLAIPEFGWNLGLLAGPVFAVPTWFSVQVVARLRPPADVGTRRALVKAYVESRRAHKEAQVRAAIAAQERRQARLAEEMAEEETAPSPELLTQLGFRKRYRLCGHPAYPDPMHIHPPTEEQAVATYREYCSDTFEEYVAKLGHTPRRIFGEPYTAETFNPRILVDWVYEGESEVFTPAGVDGAGTRLDASQ